jgi:release factor glutamine methyltransferase
LTLGATLAAARERLMRAGIPRADAAVDVDVFARTILGWDRAQLLTSLSAHAPASLEPQFTDWIRRRERSEPTAYIVGSREFWGLEFHVTPAVLIPRPETEFIVDESLQLMRAGAGGSGEAIRLADIGTGSGCIAVSLAREAPSCRLVATDVSNDALQVARENAQRHGVADRIDFVQTSYLDDVEGEFDIIAANPPYVRDGDKPALSRDVRHEPDVALFGGATGLRHIDGVLTTAVARLRPAGWIVMEFGFGQEDDVRGLVDKHPELRVDHVRADLQGLARTAIIQKT